MSRKANCYDNAVMENFFGHLKEELFHRVRFLNTDALTTALHDYIRWYNTERISTKLKGLSLCNTVLRPSPHRPRQTTQHSNAVWKLSSSAPALGRFGTVQGSEFATE